MLRSVAKTLTMMMSLLLSATTAHADVVQSPPSSCPRGRVPVTDHSGPRCELDAPTCPPGWRGVIGGTCILAECANDSVCKGNERCEKADLCVEQRPMYWEWGSASEPTSPSPPQPQQRKNNLFGEPPPSPDPSHPVDVAIDICRGDTRVCASPSQCKEGKLCLPPMVKASPRPTNGDVYSGRTPHPRATASGGGCAGCTTTTPTTANASSAVLFVLAVLGLTTAIVKKRK